MTLPKEFAMLTQEDLVKLKPILSTEIPVRLAQALVLVQVETSSDKNAEKKRQIALSSAREKLRGLLQELNGLDEAGQDRIATTLEQKEPKQFPRRGGLGLLLTKERPRTAAKSWLEDFKRQLELLDGGLSQALRPARRGRPKEYGKLNLANEVARLMLAQGRNPTQTKGGPFVHALRVCMVRLGYSDVSIKGTDSSAQVVAEHTARNYLEFLKSMPTQ